MEIFFHAFLMCSNWRFYIYRTLFGLTLFSSVQTVFAVSMLDYYLGWTLNLALLFFSRPKCPILCLQLSKCIFRHCLFTHSKVSSKKTMIFCCINFNLKMYGHIASAFKDVSNMQLKRIF